MDNLPKNKFISLDTLIAEIGRKNTGISGPKYSVLLGAGCSTPTIPLASIIIETLKKKSFCRYAPDAYLFNTTDITEETFVTERQVEFEEFVQSRQSEFIEENEIQRDELLKSLPSKLIPDCQNFEETENVWTAYKHKFENDLLYGKWFERFSESAEERQEFIEDIIKDKKPPAEYIILSFLIKAELFKTLFTTNFDDFINEALFNYADLKPRVIAHNEPLTFKKFLTERPAIIKLHGDYLFENIKNTPKEVGALEENMFNKLFKALNLYNLVVIGYNGSDASVMNAIEKIKDEKDFTLYWCYRDGDNLHWRVKHLVETTKNCFLVKIKSFNQVILQLWNIYLKSDFKIPNFIKDAEDKNKTIYSYLNQTVHEAKIEKTVPAEIISQLEISLEHLLSDNTFSEIRTAKTFEEKFQILKTYRIDIIGKAVKSIFENNRVQAKELFQKLYDQNIFEQKVIDAPIQHIGNAFSNLKIVDYNLTESIFLQIDDKIFVEKLKKATPGLLNSALGELQSVNSDKAKAIAYKLEIPKDKDYSKLTLRQLHMLFTEVNRTNAFEILETLPNDTIIEKMKTGKLDDIGFTLTKINLISPSKAKSIYLSVPNDLIIFKIKQCYLERIGQNLSVLEKINNDKTRLILKSIEADILKDKITTSNLRDFSSALIEFVTIDRFISKRLYQSVSDKEISKKISKATFTGICNALVKLNKIDTQRTSRIVKKIEGTYFAEKLSLEAPSFEGIGSSLLNLRNLDYKKAVDALVKSSFPKNLLIVSKTCEKSSEQSFFHYISTYLDLDYQIGKGIIEHINRNFLTEILKWKKLSLYTSKLPLLLKTFDELNFKNEAIFVSKVLCENKTLLLSKTDETEFNISMSLVNKYFECS